MLAVGTCMRGYSLVVQVEEELVVETFDVLDGGNDALEVLVLMSVCTEEYIHLAVTVNWVVDLLLASSRRAHHNAIDIVVLVCL